MTVPGKVYLVGAGPGDPRLITVAGLDRLREADVVVYDRLVNEALLREAGEQAELIYAGKLPSSSDAPECSGAPSGLHKWRSEGKSSRDTKTILPARPEALVGRAEPSAPNSGSHDQEAINRLLIEKAREGKRVVRLKGGDPFVFGRGGEEAEALRAAGIAFEVVPGVTSAVAVPAYAGIPVTHRGLASTFAVITGHEDPEKPESSIDWPKLATATDTLVFLMGTKTLADIVEKLVANGRQSDTPVAVIRWGTTPEQRTVTGTLADIAERVRDAGLAPPAITVVGEVVRLREKLSWFEERPLFGKRVLITRTRRQASTLARLLAAEGAIPIELPAIEIEQAVDKEQFESAVFALENEEYDWLVFTSANGVEGFFDALYEISGDARSLGGTGVAVIGPETAKALATHGVHADLVPDEYILEGLVEAFRRDHKLEGERILVARAEGSREMLIEGLKSEGAEVDELVLYKAVVPKETPAEALSLLRDGAIDIVTFTSSSTVRNLAAMLNGDLSALGTQHSALGTASRPLVACIGPITAKTAEELGLRVDVVASEHTVEGLMRAIRDYWKIAKTQMARKLAGPRF